MASNKVHLVGSLGLGVPVPETFRVLGTSLGATLRRVPDGEPGPRAAWMNWQYLALLFSPALEADKAAEPISLPGHPLCGVQPLKLADGAGAQDIRFGELGYAREARASYQDFCAAREAGVLAKSARFQVCLPSPRVVVISFCTANAAPLVAPAYEQAMLREVAAIASAVPHGDLAIQWDLPFETMIFDGRAQIPLSREMVSQSVASWVSAVPRDAEAGLHLCFGDPDEIRSLKPLDAGAMVDLANAVMAAATRALTYVHMPVPADRMDEAYFAPLERLKRDGGLELYLGLVHTDGAENMRKRLALADRFAEGFGVATECGMGRMKPARVRALLDAHADYASA